MKFLLCVALFVIGANASYFTNDEIETFWQDFKEFYNKKYTNEHEEEARRAIYEQNLVQIIEHNLSGKHTHTLAMNEFGDLTTEEFTRVMNGFKMNYNFDTTDFHFNESVEGLPKTVDWRTKGYVTPVKNQEQCGSCWAFSAVASLEGQHFKKTKKLVSLSEQNLVDCSDAEGNMGCGGGLMDQAFKYIKLNHGIDTEKSYPYEGTDDTCRFKKANVAATLTSWKDIPTGNEKALQNAVATVGPISVAIDASQFSFQFYSGGVYNEPACSTTQLDHGVTAVGYGTDNGQDYWLVKNSWGADWGLQGYIKMSRNKQNQCGIATMSSYPIV